MNSNYEVSYLIDLKRKIITFEYHKHVMILLIINFKNDE